MQMKLLKGYSNVDYTTLINFYLNSLELKVYCKIHFKNRLQESLFLI